MRSHSTEGSRHLVRKVKLVEVTSRVCAPPGCVERRWLSSLVKTLEQVQCLLIVAARLFTRDQHRQRDWTFGTVLRGECQVRRSPCTKQTRGEMLKAVLIGYHPCCGGGHLAMMLRASSGIRTFKGYCQVGEGSGGNKTRVGMLRVLMSRNHSCFRGRHHTGEQTSGEYLRTLMIGNHSPFGGGDHAVEL